MIEKEIKSGIHKHRPAFDLNYCLVDSANKRYWLSKKECKFIIKSNSLIIGQGTVLFYPDCEMIFLPNSLMQDTETSGNLKNK